MIRDIYICLNGHNLTMINEFNGQSKWHLWITNCQDTSPTFTENGNGKVFDRRTVAHVFGGPGRMNFKSNFLAHLANDTTYSGNFEFYNLDLTEYSSAAVYDWGIIKTQNNSSLANCNFIISNCNFDTFHTGGSFTSNTNNALFIMQNYGHLKLYNTSFNNIVARQFVVMTSYNTTNVDFETYGYLNIKNSTFINAFVGGWGNCGSHTINSDFTIEDSNFNHLFCVDVDGMTITINGNVYVRRCSYSGTSNSNGVIYWNGQYVNNKFEINSSEFIVDNVTTTKAIFHVYQAHASVTDNIVINVSTFSITNCTINDSSSVAANQVAVIVLSTANSKFRLNCDKGYITDNTTREAVIYNISGGTLTMRGNEIVMERNIYSDTNYQSYIRCINGVNTFEGITIRNQNTNINANAYEGNCLFCLTGTNAGRAMNLKNIKVYDCDVKGAYLYLFDESGNGAMTLSGDNEFFNNKYGGWGNATRSFIEVGGTNTFKVVDGTTKIYNNTSNVLTIADVRFTGIVNINSVNGLTVENALHEINENITGMYTNNQQGGIIHLRNDDANINLIGTGSLRVKNNKLDTTTLDQLNF